MEVKVPLPKAFEDKRGTIQPLVDGYVPPFAGPGPQGSCLLIYSKPGAVRGNHWHKTDAHYCYVLEGAVDYYHRPVGSQEPPAHVHVRAGQMFFTPSRVEHAMVFLGPSDTLMVVMARNSRTQSEYETDLVRLVEPLQLQDG